MENFMNIFKRIFGKKKREKKQENECWYNNYREEADKPLGEPLEGVAFSSPNMPYYTTSFDAENAH